MQIAEVDDSFYDSVMDLNVRSLVAASSAAIPFMRRAGHGNIINVTSIAARHGGGNGAVLYASAKGFVSTFTRGLAKEVVRDGIRVNAVSPGVITTPFHERYSTPATSPHSPALPIASDNAPCRTTSRFVATRRPRLRPARSAPPITAPQATSRRVSAPYRAYQTTPPRTTRLLTARSLSSPRLTPRCTPTDNAWHLSP